MRRSLAALVKSLQVMAPVVSMRESSGATSDHVVVVATESPVERSTSRSVTSVLAGNF